MTQYLGEIKEFVNGVLANGKFYPWKIKVFENIVASDVITPNKQCYLYIHRIIQTSSCAVGDSGTWNYNSVINGVTCKLAYYRTRGTAAETIDKQWNDRIGIVCDQSAGLTLTITTAPTLCCFTVYYAEIDEILPEFPENAVIKVCDLWSWIKGECVHGSIG